MAQRIILLSGAIASGKTTLGDTLVFRYGIKRLKTRQLIHAAAGGAVEREHLQLEGERLDRETGGKWVVAELKSAVQGMPEAVVLIDAVRIEPQITAIRDAYGPRVIHVHLTAPLDVLAGRYEHRDGDVQELASYDAVRKSATEAQIDALAAIADIVIDTNRNTPEDVVVRVASHLGLYGRSVERLVDVLVGGQYGSEGKGQVAASLARDYALLVRVGGPNAGHTVYETPRPYTFHHLPSGTRASSAKVMLGPGAVISLPRLLEEIRDCALDPERLFIDPQAILIDEVDRELEAGKLTGTISSTAQGVGGATARKVLRTAAEPPVRLAKDASELRSFLKETRLVLEDAFAAGQRIFLEGTQGTGLSLHHGHFPFVTSRDTTVSGCLAEAGIAPSRVRKIIMVCRTYPIRVEGPSGPMGMELSWDDISRRSGIPAEELERTEKTSTTKRRRRVAEFDWTLLRRAASLNGPTDIALTFVDYLSIKNRDARRFEQLTEETIRFIEEVERVAAAPVSLIATRFHVRSIIDRRAW